MGRLMVEKENGDTEGRSDVGKEKSKNQQEKKKMG